ncbi:pentapeptide repeat-containing protein [Dapis sp. BLCC M229]|uniref:pentapeptide repeat-containing protein n=1 Tax=Dapis sp. BLCC M229 TaxID=3400188 RepID=UPI003CF46D84
MNSPLTPEELGALFQEIESEPTHKLSELAKVAGLNLAEDYVGIDLSGDDLSEDDLSGANLSFSNLRNVNLKDTNLTNSNLSGADLSAANLSAANLSGADLSGADLSAADLSAADLSAADLNGANLSGANLSAANLNGANLSKANLNGADLNGANFSKTDVSGTKLKTKLDKTKLDKTKLDKTSLSEADFIGADFRGDDRSKTDLNGAYLQREYCAALAIDDWDFFLPRAHKNKPVKGKRYRIFEPEWKQVVLLWLGRKDVKKEEKEEFIQALTEFKDGCGNFLKPGIERGFYGCRAYFLAAAAISQLSECTKTQTDQIVEKIVHWANDFNEIETEAKTVLLETPRKDTINALVELFNSNPNNYTCSLVASTLGEIGTGNEKAIDALIQLLMSTSDDYTRRQAAASLGKIDPGNKNATNAVIEFFSSTSDNSTHRQAASSLGKILTKKYMTKVITFLKDYLSVKGYRDNSYHSKECYKIIWKCAQTLPYPEFYQAWHPPLFKKPRWLS